MAIPFLGIMLVTAAGRLSYLLSLSCQQRLHAKKWVNREESRAPERRQLLFSCGNWSPLWNAFHASSLFYAAGWEKENKKEPTGRCYDTAPHKIVTGGAYGFPFPYFSFHAYMSRWTSHNLPLMCWVQREKAWERDSGNHIFGQRPGQARYSLFHVISIRLA